MGKRLADFIVDEREEPLYEDDRAMTLSHYHMAERCMQAEYVSIRNEMTAGQVSNTLVYMLEGGFKGFHNLQPSDLILEYKVIEDDWYALYESGGLPWPVFDEDPIHNLLENIG